VNQLTTMDRVTLPHAQSTIMLYKNLTKDSISKSDLQSHSRLLAIMPFGRPCM